ncbi:tRNA (uridine(34)/cytosine(34)/5-carboxymethylaminomethyluridine(34)-2'-O)-methyltransferase TrmL [Cysteiniphilum sp. QT6929]|uniref:tRNA (uridine(34)/cytosine(34)/5- carboxymethylaminomethyluridine(34)-2'-O)- methyltransferase TrmL n=1 Tax=Cysteiniphilum sp. QT6929 TaxID=2975055 RepID=UPI0024B36BE3|nr:tRNA (uridine(34)/cytosine(34)/5-carboxymethylaminomethyluridine(34)-2'-O)-methyltransferase TrmL [Cysteiniphilum sp. QT6929]WHN65500.1 tRNA (uridine(34)/cytosine(34)/5-carboxymethylaminomethyluridine(34)-2'-O)-methyltransferase TrmL [Cysteiniphilum sp. QT6929]
MIHIALYEPEIPPNTGNIIRLCANAGAKLHLIEPLGFDLDDKKLRRAGLDYHEFAAVLRYKNFQSFVEAHAYKRIWACTTKANQYYHQVEFQKDDILLLGPESRGLPQEVRDQLSQTQIKLPMLANSRSLNLSNATAIMLFEAWRQLGFEGAL